MLIPGLRLGAAIGGAAVAFLLLLPGAAPAATKGADLRVVNSAGRVLAEQRQYTGTVKIKTDPRADCFGAPGGSGDRVRVRGATALGLVRDALGSDRDLRPLSVTDQFSFGLAVCGIGGYEAHGSSFWYLKHEHAGAQVGGDQLRLSDGDRNRAAQGDQDRALGAVADAQGDARGRRGAPAQGRGTPGIRRAADRRRRRPRSRKLRESGVDSQPT